ncbi:hypothetical protein B0H11DRAFT_2331996 [Mycena galericulata]|nr:hypothetical protein B0H11DRAFT_2331996 [Mycena galericulata]
MVAKCRSALRSRIQQLFNQLMRPKLRNLITDMYKDVFDILNDDSYSAAEYLGDTYTESKSRLFFSLALDFLLRPRSTVKVPLLIHVSTSHNDVSVVSDDLRRRAKKIPAVAGAVDDTQDNEDVDEFYNGSGMTWKLSATAALKL